MEAHKSFKVECLRYEDAWKLFEEKVGRDILDSHPNIPELVETVAKECGGLPLALITVGMEKRVYSRLQLRLFTQRPRNQGYCIVGTLLHACLLEEEEGNRVKMHDVIRDMALWIASTFENKNEKFLVLAGVGLTAAPSVGV
ncbi:hypothetical protein KPL71_008717 [Citrus sinensis]|uniref:Uncharacterized protein n=1 Tax=Citrus sinensis TaxID=2711 RepID=A0ACB8M8Y8_CITSI|nr:hypothetical protein KPL71_008717 [Citrus sinensis]